MENNIDLGYGNFNELIPSFQEGGELTGQPNPEQVIDPQSQIESGIQAFLQSRDPEIAIQVVEMLAETMGFSNPQTEVAGSPSPSNQGQNLVANVGTSLPQAFRKGGKLYKREVKAKQKPKLSL